MFVIVCSREDLDVIDIHDMFTQFQKENTTTKIKVKHLIGKNEKSGSSYLKKLFISKDSKMNVNI